MSPKDGRLSSDAVGTISSVAAVFYAEQGTMSEGCAVVGTDGATSEAGGAHPRSSDRPSAASPSPLRKTMPTPPMALTVYFKTCVGAHTVRDSRRAKEFE